MMPVRVISRCLWNAEDTADTRIIDFDWMYNLGTSSKMLQGTLTTGDTFVVNSVAYGKTVSETDVTVLAPVTGSPISTTSFILVLTGPYQRLSITKTGTAGPATLVVVG